MQNTKDMCYEHGPSYDPSYVAEVELLYLGTRAGHGELMMQH